jgi:AcrR family transcriptional regulator
MHVMLSNASSSGRSRAQRSEHTRERVLDAAVLCLEQHGFAACNLARIAEQAGLTTGAIQHLFPDKTALLAAVVERGFARMVEHLAHAPVAGATLTDRVSALVDSVWAGYDAATTRASFEVLFAMRADTSFRDRSQAFTLAMGERIDRLWMGTLWDVPCKRGRHLEAQRLVYTTLNGLALERTLIPGAFDVTRVLGTLKRSVLHILERGA